MTSHDTWSARIERARALGTGLLDLSELGAAGLPTEAPMLPGLQGIDLSGNRLTVLPDWLRALPQLVFLDLGQNRLTTLDPGIARLQALQRLDLSENRLTELPAVLAALPELAHLDLSDNRIQRLDDDALPGALEVLRIEGNPIAHLGPRLARLVQHAASPVRRGDVPGSRGSDLATLERLLAQGAPPSDGPRRFDAPTHRVDFELRVEPAAIPSLIDAYYRRFGHLPLSLRTQGGQEIELTRQTRKSAQRVVARLGEGQAATAHFPPTVRLDQVDGVGEFARSVLAGLEGVRLRGPGVADSAAPATPSLRLDADDRPGVEVAQVHEQGASETPATPVFHLLLEGRYARGAAIIARASADLVFRHAIPTGPILAAISSAALDDARKADIEILLHVSVRGGLALVGRRAGVARFKDGAMIAPVAFRLEAGATCGQESAIHVDFTVRGETVHQSDFAIAIVADEAALAAAAGGTQLPGADVPASLAADASGLPVADIERIELQLDFERSKGRRDGRLRLDLRHYRPGRGALHRVYHANGDLDRASLQARLDQVRAVLAPCFDNAAFWGRFTGADTGADAEAPGKAEARALAESMHIVACAGHALDAMLREHPELAQALDYIEQLPAGQPTLTIRTDDVFVPWELLYPERRSANMTDKAKALHPLRADRFWGARFAIETVQREGASASPAALQRRQVSSAPCIAMNVDPHISAASEPPPYGAHQAWLKRLHEDGIAATIADSCGAIRATLQDGEGVPTFIYVYCHGQPARPLGNAGERLDLVEGCPLTPADLDADTPYEAAPIVFINACGSGAHSALTYSNFLSRFRARGALGMIATTHSVPVAFGATFGAQVFDCYLARQGSFAVAMRDLRRRHVERGNPVPLLYTLQCQLTLKPSSDGNPP